MTVRWKTSLDGARTFISDKDLSSSFFQISNVQIASSAEGTVAIVFEGVPVEGGANGIYVMCTPDGGNNWTQASFVTEGTGACVAVHGSTVFIGLNRQVDGTTDPLKADTDNDGILDGEEVSLGEDGWITNPVLVDTDSDGVSDRNEIIGSTKCGQKLDPTSKDTDGDGFNDNVDRYLGDMMLRFNINYFNYWQDVNFGSTHDIFFTLKIGDKTLSTMRLYDVVKNQPRYFSMDYYIDASDVGTSMSFVISAVADDAGTLGDDIKLDIEATGADACDYPFTFYFSNGRTYYVAQGEDESGNWIKDANTEAEVRWFVETVVKPKANVIVVNSTDSSGLYRASDNSLRYNEDEQMYLLYITTPSSSANFASGVNVVIVPRYLALQSKLNGTLFAGATGTELSGAKFYSTDDLEDSSSGHIVAVIEKSMTNAQAESLLTRLTHDAGNERIGNAVRIASSNVYTLGLPNDVQSRIPYVDMNSSPTGAPPNYLSVGAVFEFVWNCIVTAAGEVVNLVSSLVQAGIDLVCTLVSSAVTAIRAAVNEIVDAFNAFVAWIIDFAIDIILSPIVSLLNDIWSGVVGWVAGLGSMLTRLSMSVGSGEETSGSAAIELARSILASDVFIALLAIASAVFVAMMVLQPVVAPFSFIIGLVMPIVMVTILATSSQMIGDAFIAAGSAIDQAGQAIVGSILGSEMVSDLSIVLGIIFGSMAGLMSFVATAVGGSFWAFAFSLCGAILSMVAMVQALSSAASLDMLSVAVFGTVLSGSALLANSLSESVEELLCPSYDACSSIISWTSFGVSVVGLGTVAYNYNEGS